MKSCPVPTEKVVFVCGECEDGLELKKWIKKRLKKDAPDAGVKVVRTGCMGICPEDRVSACVAGARPGSAVLRLDPSSREDRHSLLLAVLDQP